MEGDDWTPRVSAEFADRLIERRDRFGYFMATAAVGVIAFTLNELGEAHSLLRRNTALVIAGCVLLLLSAGASLLLTFLRHEQYSRFLYGRDNPRKKEETDTRARNTRKWMDRILGGFAGLFVIGVLVIVTAYAKSV